MQFIDEAKIYIRSGDGGNGCVSFRREKYIPMGGPDGGDGGRGASIIFIANPHLNTLSHFRFKRHFKAPGGEGGMGSNKNGKAAKDMYIPVPVGTQIFDETGSLLLFDFTKKDQEFKILKGGKGGLGNTHFKSSVNQAPERSTKGIVGEEADVWLKLKLLSDVGLVGLPNAGKSTLLSKITSAKPKIADYPFTTLTPILGVVSVDDEEFVVADIPGLIEGAHEGHGLGDKFLKHIERCGLLIHLIDITSEDIIGDYDMICHELKEYSEILGDKKEIICLNKTDLLSEKEIDERTKSMEKHTKNKIYLISAGSSQGLKPLMKEALRAIKNKEED